MIKSIGLLSYFIQKDMLYPISLFEKKNLMYYEQM